MIAKSEEAAIEKKKSKIIAKLLALHQIYTDKIGKLLELSVYQRVFKKDNDQLDYYNNYLLTFFHVMVANDPLVHSFLDLSDMRQISKLTPMKTQWSLIQDTCLTEWLYEMSQIGVFEHFQGF